MRQKQNEPIAVVGMGCRFPGGSNSPSKLWDLLKSPSDVSETIRPNRFNIDRFYHADGSHHGTANVRRSYFLDSVIDRFDARFFSIPPGEAEAIDPQQRLLLEVVYEALESSGMTMEELSNSDTSVYVGLMCQDFFAIQAQDVNSLPTYAATGVAASNASSRVSYFFNWHGPSMTIDTACSSSMVGVCEAVQSLRNGTSRVSVACGTNLLISPLPYIMESNLGMLSPDGQGRMWDEKANGYARGEGVASLVLKTLSSAIADGDNISFIIREIGVNHDGKTKGLTMPSASAQASLIRSTYQRAGLDPTTKSGRCQFFEAHGTGTPAGDPQEAEALCRAFYPCGSKDEHDELLVGSVKTIIGHTEGTAGIAGLMKAGLALKNELIPPNLLFNSLNPALEPFTKNMRIPMTAEPWPELEDGTPRRASVNSFGFGGVNAHAILESHTPTMTKSSVEVDRTARQAACPIPAIFSAASEKSLLAMLRSVLEFLDNQPDIDMFQLAYTLSTRRTNLLTRLAISTPSIEQLKRAITQRLGATDKGIDSPPVSIAALSAAPVVLGVFTGQGAQWPTMAAKLLMSNFTAARILRRLDQSLQSLPEAHRPRWSLMDELSADSTSSRVTEAVISQPLCTAVQIVLVDLLRAAGVRFKAVVGHSSGEIAAAYAAGYLSSHDAMLIAYYRGYFAALAASASGERGSMIAVETTYEDAKDLCELDAFVGRLWVAAHNSPTSVTLSGGADAVVQARGIFEEEGKFSRILRVDTAYHSQHMLRCVPQYLEALHQCNIQPLQPQDVAPTWYSSVHGKPAEAQFLADLTAKYWVDNMVQPVHLHAALQSLLATEKIIFALEVGPHPALQKPVTDTIQHLTGQSCPYSGTLKRGKDDTEAISDALGSLWSLFGRAAVDLGKFLLESQEDQTPPRGLSGLPSYPWDHDRVLWAESRVSKWSRTQDGAFHDLLGTRTADSVPEHWQWKNVLRADEIHWLSGHSLQGQVVFPGTGYIALAMEASMQLAESLKQPVESIDLLNLEIRKAIAISTSAHTELLVSMTNVSSPSADDEHITANFAAHSTTRKETGQLIQNCSGHVRIKLGHAKSSMFPERCPTPTDTAAVDVDRFYQVLRDEFGYVYEGPFRGLTRIHRKMGYATASIQCHAFESKSTRLLFHPGMLDSALQGLNAAYSAPGDGRLRSIVAPTSCERVTLVPSLCGINMDEQVEVDCIITDSREGSISGDVDVYSAGCAQKVIEIEGMRFSPFSAATSKDDRLLFQEVIMAVDNPDADIVFDNRRSTPQEHQRGLDAERVAFFYLKKIHLSVGLEEREKLPWYRQALIKSAQEVYRSVKAGEHPFILPDWVNDSQDTIVHLMDKYGNDAEFQLAKAVAEHVLLPTVLSGEESILEYMTKDGYLDKYYMHGVGFELLNDLAAGVMDQICTKFPHTNILEVGAGTGGATKAILDRVNNNFSSFTYTDISSGFFERAASIKFKSYSHNMAFKTLNIEEDVTSQGFKEHSFDIVIASNVLHATKSLKTTLNNSRRLLKPGGYLVLIEVIRTDVIRHGLVMGGLPGWWIGEQDGRHGGPSITIEQWDIILRETGFAGIETNSPMPDPVVVPGSVIVARARDDQFSLLQTPLACTSSPKLGTAMIIGGETTPTMELATELISRLTPFFQRIIRVDCIDDIPETPDSADKYHIISLTECDSDLFRSMDENRWQKLQRLLGSASSVLWLLQDSRNVNPYGGITLGLFRTLFYEIPGTLLQTLELCDGMTQLESNGTVVAELALRLRQMSLMARSGSLDKMLWEFEPELILRNSKIYTTRVRPHADQNARYNSAKRSITSLQSIDSGKVTLVRSSQSYILHQRAILASAMNLNSGDADELVNIRVSCSLLSSLKTPVGYVFVALGSNIETGEKVLCFSDSNSSIVTVHPSWSTTLGQDNSEIVDEQYLSFAVAELMAQQIVSIVPAAGTVLIHEPDPVAASLLAKRFSDMKRAIAFTTSRPELRSRRNWIYMHQKSTKRNVDSAIPQDISLYVDGAEPVDSHAYCQTLGSRIVASLSLTCHKVALADLISQEASVLSNLAPSSVATLLRKITTFASSMRNSVPDGAPLNMLTLKQVASPSSSPKPSSLIHWQPEHPVPISVQPVLTRKDLFRHDRTYWLAGLSGDLGRSLADFMASHGAKHVVLSSRAPKVDETWVQGHRERGTVMKYFSCDLMDYGSVKHTHDEIVKSMPVIEGVANGAMVLRDASFMKLSFEDFDTVLRTKVASSVNLDKLFSEDTTQHPLDWFIGFSSIVGITGNPGQAAYSAGNCFMKALGNQRRSRGLAGSVVDISRVIGVGYIERERLGRLTKEHQERLSTRSGALPMSENDLHQLFAEAIISGRPDSGLNAEIITGLAPITTEQAKDAFWATNARFGLLIRQEMATDTTSSDNTVSKIPLRQLLKAATTADGVKSTLQGALTTKLRSSMFLLESDTLADSTPLVDMGVDSLVGVEVRAWFLKELGADVPVMKILGGITIAELVEHVLTQELLQNLQGLAVEEGKGGIGTKAPGEK